MWYDLLVLAILAYTTIRGAMKGAIWQIAGIAGLVVCFVFAESISAAAGPYVKLQPPLNNWVVMIGAYLVFTFIAFALARLITEYLEKIKFGDFNKHLGAILGFVKGAVICLVLTFFVVTVSADAREALKNSRSGRAAAIIMDRLHPVMPEKLQDALDKYIHQLDSPDLDLKYAHERSAEDGHDHGDDADSPHHDDLVLPEGETPAPRARRGKSLPPEFDELLSRVPADVREDFRDVLWRSVEKTEPDDRAELLDGLIRALRQINDPDDVTSLRDTLSQPPDRLLSAITGWLSGPGAGASSVPERSRPAAIPADEPPLNRRQQLLAEISGVMSDYPKAQAMIQTDIEKSLADVPEKTALGVLEDWRADLATAAGGSPRDPDPTTTAATTLRDRISRQVAGQRIDEDDRLR